MDSVSLSRRGGVATITIDRPRRKNALGDEHFAELGRLVAAVADDPGDRVLVITGAGGEFCSGADLAATGRLTLSPLEGMRAIGAVARAIRDLPKPTIARVDGVAAGAGANLALCCDLVIASDRARFSEIFSQRGLSVDFGGSWLLPRLVGLAKAKELAFLADIIGAAEMLELGLVNRVVPVSELDGLVAAWADRLAAGPAVALSLTKALLESGATSTFAQAIEAEAQAQAVNLMGPEAREALAAFAEKREPRFDAT
jgi:2-(1,2-epoxy-1,2-dihydrophenyl)acetyl-CoA isomerase